MVESDQPQADAAELRRLEERYRLAVEASTDVVWDWERATDRVVWNDRLREAFGLEPPGGPLGATLDWLLECVHPEDRVRARAAWDAALNDRAGSWVVEYRLRRADGAYGVVLDRGRAIHGEDGRAVRLVTSVRDVTRRVRIEEDQRFLAEASRLLASSLDHERTLDAVARLAIPSLADWCAIDLLDDRGGARAVAGAHADPSKEPVLHELQRRYGPTTADDRPVARVLRSGRVVLVPAMTDNEIAATSVDAEHARLRREVGFASLLVVPLVVGGRTLGAATFAAGPARPPYRPENLAVAEELGRRAAVALEHARLYREAQEQAATHVALSGELRAAAEARRQGEERFRRLATAFLAIGAAGSRALDDVLDEIAAQAKAVLGADHARVQLSASDGGGVEQPSGFLTEGDLRVPMTVDGDTVGFLVVRWEHHPADESADAEAARLLAQHAATVVRTAQALDEARRAGASCGER